MKSPLGRLDVAVAAHYQDRLAALIRVEKPQIVIETGLETGFGAEYILQALDANGSGHLWSIDPKPHADYIGNPIVHPRFTFVEGKSQDELFPLFREIGPFDLFVHDSDHDPECQFFEYEAAWKMVRPGGIIASDDCFWGMPPHLTWSKFLVAHGIPISAITIIGNAQYFRKP